MICTLHRTLLERSNEKDEMDKACVTYGGEEKYIEGFGRET